MPIYNPVSSGLTWVGFEQQAIANFPMTTVIPNVTSIDSTVIGIQCDFTPNKSFFVHNPKYILITGTLQPGVGHTGNNLEIYTGCTPVFISAGSWQYQNTLDNFVAYQYLPGGGFPTFWVSVLCPAGQQFINENEPTIPNPYCAFFTALVSAPTAVNGTFSASGYWF